MSFMDVLKKGRFFKTEAPFVSLPLHIKRKFVCDTCFSLRTELLKCQFCGFVYYCDLACQDKSQPLHQKECLYLKRFKNVDFRETEHLLLRIILKFQMESAQNEYFNVDMYYKIFSKFAKHTEKFKNDPDHLLRFNRCISILNCLLPHLRLDKDILLELYAIICMHTTSVLDDFGNIIGNAIYLQTSSIPHSCMPNSVLVFCGNILCVRMIEDTSHSFNVRISYVDLIKSTKERQQELCQKYDINCNCLRCEWDYGKDEMNSMRCAKMLCEGLIYIDSEKELQSNYICSACRMPVDGSSLLSYFEAIEMTRTVLDNIKWTKFNKQITKEQYDNLYLCLEKQEHFSPYNVYRIRTLQIMFDFHIINQNWSAAFSMGCELLSGMQKYYGEYHPELSLLYGKLVRILLQLHAWDIPLFKRTKKCLRITHGKKHRFYKQTIFIIRQALNKNRLVDLEIGITDDDGNGEEYDSEKEDSGNEAVKSQHDEDISLY